MSSNKNSIRWTKKEWQRLVDECLQRYGYGDWTLSNIAAVRSVQKEILPEARQRPPGSMKGNDNIKPFHALIAAAKKKGLAGDADTAPPQEKAPPLRDWMLTDLGLDKPPFPDLADKPLTPAIPSTSEPTERSVTDVLSTFIAGVLVESVKKLLTNGEIARMLRSLQNGGMPSVAVDSSEGQPRHSPVGASSAPPKEQKLSCLVCGFKGHQQSEINARTATGYEKLHLRFWYAENPNEGITVLKQKAQSADVVLFSMEATSHTAVATVQTVGKRIVRVTGGMNAMLDALQRLHKEQAAKS